MTASEGAGPPLDASSGRPQRRRSSASNASPPSRDVSGSASKALQWAQIAVSAIVGIVVVAGQVLMTQMKASSDLDLARRQRDNSLAHLAVSGAVSKSTFRVLIQTAGLSEKAQVTDAQSGQPVGTTNLANAADLALRTQEFHVTNTHGVKATNVVVNIGSGVPLESVIPQYPNDKAASSVSPDRMSAVVSLNQLSVEQELVIDIVVAEPFKTSDYESWSAALHITPTCDECDKSSNSGPVV